MKKYKEMNKPINIPLIATLSVQGLAFIIFTIWAARVVLLGFSEEYAYDIVARSSLVIAYFVFVAAIPLYCKCLASKLFQAVALTLTAAVAIGLFPYIAGGIQDSLGYICTSYFGGQVSCAENWQFYTSITLFNPLIFLTLVVITTLVAIVGILDVRRQSGARRAYEKNQ